MAHPCYNDSVVVIAHSLDHADARDQSQYDEACGYAKKGNDDGKHCWPTILHGQRC